MSKLTVGEAKTMGVEFVCGDYLSVSCIGPIIQVSPSNLNDINGGEFGGLSVKQFSWRLHETSGKPSDIDYPVLVFVDEEECKGMISDFYWNIDDSRSSIVKWKPDLVELEQIALKSVQVKTPEEKELFEAMQSPGEIKAAPEIELIPKTRLRNSRSAMKKRIKRRDKTISKKQATINLLKSDIEGMEREVNALCSIFGKQFVGSRDPESLGDNDWGFMQLFDAISEMKNKMDRAIRSLESSGFVDHGGEYWKPPVNKDYGELIARLLAAEDKLSVLQGSKNEWPQHGDRVLCDNLCEKSYIGTYIARLPNTKLMIIKTGKGYEHWDPDCVYAYGKEEKEEDNKRQEIIAEMSKCTGLNIEICESLVDSGYRKTE